MKTILSTLIITIGFCTISNAQTHEIAHKSHSGSEFSLDRSSPERFGEIISPPLIKIERIQTKTDTATIFYFGFTEANVETHRIENHPIFNAPNIDIDSLQSYHYPDVEFVGFSVDFPLEYEEEPKRKKKKKNWVLPLTSPRSGTPIKGIVLIISLAIATVWSLSIRREERELS